MTKNNFSSALAKLQDFHALGRQRNRVLEVGVCLLTLFLGIKALQVAALAHRRRVHTDALQDCLLEDRLVALGRQYLLVSLPLAPDNGTRV